MNFDQIPADLRALDQWVVWKYEEVPGNPKPTKVPYRVANPDVKADSTKQGTWGSFEDALAAAEVDGVDGAGFVFSKDDPLTGVDIDDCRDPTTGELHPAASRIMLGLDGYTEISPSGTGVHIIVRAKLNGDRHSTKPRFSGPADGWVRVPVIRGSAWLAGPPSRRAQGNYLNGVAVGAA